MDQHVLWVALGINLLLVTLLVTGFSFASVLAGPKRRMSEAKGLPYETGMPPLEGSGRNMWVSYYRYAVLFVIFDVDLAFLVPWILMRRQMTLESLAALGVFLFWVGLTLAYVWRRGALECE